MIQNFQKYDLVNNALLVSGGKRNKIYLDFIFLFCVIQMIKFMNILSLCHLEGMNSDLKINFL